MKYDDSELSEQISKEQYVNFVNLVIKCYDYLDFIQIVRNIEKNIWRIFEELIPLWNTEFFLLDALL